jgi:hypothetical protein
VSYTLLFEAQCAACSRAAQAVAGLGIRDLVVRGLSDPPIVAQLAQAGLEQPTRPALLIQEGTEVRLVTGWAMRWTLVRLLGWRRAGRILGLISTEGFAHAARMGTVSRRGFLGGGVATAAGALGSMLFPGSALAAATPPPTRSLVPARPADLQAALSSTDVQTAISTWGSAEAAGAVHDATNPVIVFTFTGRPDVFLFVDNTPGVAASKRVAVALAANADGSMSYVGPDGTPYATLVKQAGGVVVVEAPTSKTPPKVVCFYHCLKRHIGSLSQACVNACGFCAASSGPSRIAPCLQCFLCAGHLGPTCAIECFKK